MELALNEYTTKSLIKHLTKQFGNKLSGKPFNKSDIKQYCMRGHLPHRYGGNKIEETKEEGVVTIKVFAKDYKLRKEIKAEEKKKSKKQKVKRKKAA